MNANKPNHKQFYWAVVVIASTLVFSLLAFVFKPEPNKTEAKAATKLVRTITAKKSDQRAVVQAFGTVQSDREVALRSEVSGRVIEQSDKLVIGGIVQEGEVLLRLDPRDYRNSVEQEKAAVEKAKFELEQERGRQVVAKREWEQLGPTIKTTEISEDLALRKPHLRDKQAAYTAALSRLQKAQLDLDRTVLTSPLDAIVLSESVEMGDYITPQTELATLAGTERFRLQVSIPLSKLKWIQLPSKGEKGSAVSILQDLGGKTVLRQGRILRMLGDLDPGGRMARILVAIDDPLGLQDNTGDAHPLLIGTYIQVEFEGPQLDNVFLLPRAALRDNDNVWIKNHKDELEIRQVSVVMRKEESILVDEGIEEGDEVIISNLPIAIPGTPLRTLDEAEPK